MGVEIARIMTPAGLEQVMEWRAGTCDPISWLVIQECAAGVKAETIASGLNLSLEDLDSLANELTGERDGLAAQGWKNAVMIMRASGMMNQNTIAGGWDGIEALAIQRLGQFMSTQGSQLTVKDALEIATAANKASRRHLGEGSRAGMNVSVRQGGGGNSDIEMELRSGNLGSIRMSLSQRVRDQLSAPRTIEAEARESNREMLSVDDTRKLVDVKSA